MADIEIDKDLMKSLRLARKRPRNFAIIAKGLTCLKLIVSKRRIKDGDLIKAKKEYHGNAIVRGLVTGGDGPELVFQVTEEVSLLEAKFKLFIKEHTGLPWKPRFAVVLTQQEVDDETADEPDETAGEPGEDAASQNAPRPRG